MSEAVKTLSANVLWLHALGELADAFRSSGIELIVLKGAALLGGEYPDFSARRMGDVDILVRPLDWGAAQEVLAAMGATDRAIAAGRPATRETYYEAAYTLPVSGESGVPIDLHRTLTWPAAFPIEVDRLFESAAPHPLPDLANRGVLRLGVEHFVLHLALHRFQHQYDDDSRNYEDAARLIASPDFDPTRLVGEARRWGLQSVLFLFLDRGAIAGIIERQPNVLRATTPSVLRQRALRIASELPAGRAKQLALFWASCHRARAVVGFPLWYLGLRARDVARLASDAAQSGPRKSA